MQRLFRFEGVNCRVNDYNGIIVFIQGICSVGKTATGIDKTVTIPPAYYLFMPKTKESKGKVKDCILGIIDPENLMKSKIDRIFVPSRRITPMFCNQHRKLKIKKGSKPVVNKYFGVFVDKH